MVASSGGFDLEIDPLPDVDAYIRGNPLDARITGSRDIPAIIPSQKVFASDWIATGLRLASLLPNGPVQPYKENERPKGLRKRRTERVMIGRFRRVRTPDFNTTSFLPGNRS